ncbi:MAG: hypothetical protein ACKPKO_52500, partial [Candidatus Fonsibacter sp.]
EEVETISKEQVNALRVILDNKYANLVTMIRPGVSIESNQFTYAARENIASRDCCSKLQYCSCPVYIKQKPDVQTAPSEQATRFAKSRWTNTRRSH